MEEAFQAVKAALGAVVTLAHPSPLDASSTMWGLCCSSTVVVVPEAPWILLKEAKHRPIKI
jgi:hypothetical protein